MAETDASQLVCSNCDYKGLYGDDDGHFYCLNCNSQAEDIIDRGNADEDFVDKGGTALYSAVYKRTLNPTPTPATATYSDHMGPTEPADFGDAPKGVLCNDEDYYNTIRFRYVMGVQLLIQYQCEALVEQCGVTSLVCGIAAHLWLNFVDSTRVFAADWADITVLQSEKGEKRYQVGKHCVHEPRSLHNERMVIIWCKSLKKTIPLSYSLAISYLACHIAKEPILPTDIVKWAIEGKLPYFGAYPKIAESIKEIERRNKHVAVVCPLKASTMFRPLELSLQKLEATAASIAQSVGLSLPPVNFYRIALRYLKQLSLPVENIIPYACRIQEWSMPPDLWLSANVAKLPSRVSVMSILIVAIRILYNLNGFGKWETSLSTPTRFSSLDDQVEDLKSNVKIGAVATPRSSGGELGATSSSVHKFESDSTELLRNLDKKYDDLSDKFEYSKDLPTYLQYCKDVVFAGLEPLYKDPTLIEELWDFYEKHRKDIEPSEEFKTGSSQKRSRDDDKFYTTPLKDIKMHKDEKMSSSPSADSKFPFQNYSAKLEPDVEITQQSSQTCQVPTTAGKGVAFSQDMKDTTLKYLKIDMEDHRFCYIPPRVEIKRHDHLHYERKRAKGSLAYVAHADYYILLRACAKVAEVDIRIMHVGVLTLERRLAWIEKWINHSLVEKCSSGPVDNATDDLDAESVSLSDLNI